MKHALARPLEQTVGPELFRAEVLAWAKRVGVRPREIRLRDMKSKWASCSSRGRLTFDLGLLRQPARFRTEAVVHELLVHELLHMKLPNHGKLFKSLLRVYLARS